MTQSTTCQSRYVSPRGSLAALGQYLHTLDLFGPIRERVHIAQKVVKDTPLDKVYDLFITLLCGAEGIVQVNTLLRTDPGLQRAFGRQRCAEQSVIQQTLDACSQDQVNQLRQALAQIFQQHSRSVHHDFSQRMLLLDVDVSGMPSGSTAALATKGYFGGLHKHRGRQLGRVYASDYDEIVVDELFRGDISLVSVLMNLANKAADVLHLESSDKPHTLVRFDAGGGSLSNCNQLLEQGYAFLGKDLSGTRARLLARTVTHWYVDAHDPARQFGWITAPAREYARSVLRIGVRARKNNGQWAYSTVLVAGLSLQQAQQMCQQTGLDVHDEDPQAADILTYLRLYDQRGGGIETSFRGDKSGLGVTKRSKKREAAQQIVTLLGSLAHNVLIWFRDGLAATSEQFARYGIKRLVRDICQISGKLRLAPDGHVQALTLNRRAPSAAALLHALRSLLVPLHLALNLDQT